MSKSEEFAALSEYFYIVFLRPAKVGRIMYAAGDEVKDLDRFSEADLSTILSADIAEYVFICDSTIDEPVTGGGADDDDEPESAAKTVEAIMNDIFPDDQGTATAIPQEEAEAEPEAEEELKIKETVQHEMTAGMLFTEALAAGVICRAGVWYRYRIDPDCQETTAIARGRTNTIEALAADISLFTHIQQLLQAAG